jgi:DNA modification methylase
MTIHLVNDDNMKTLITRDYDVIFADYVYENFDFRWIDKYWNFLKPNGIFIAMTDFHTIFELGMKLKSMPNAYFVNHLVWKNEWGNHPKRMMHQCFDDIVIVSKGKNYKFYPDRIQIPKVTKTKGLNPSGRETKTATAFISDICLTTTSKERVKDYDGHLVKWQKPLSLMDRIIKPFSDEGDVILDLFMGVGTMEVWSILNNRDCIGIEIDRKIFTLAQERIKGIKNDNNNGN